MMGFSLSAFGIIASIVLLAGYVIYRVALPKPICGIPYNKKAATSPLGDVPTAMKWHKETKERYSWVWAQCIDLDSPVV